MWFTPVTVTVSGSWNVRSENPEILSVEKDSHCPTVHSPLTGLVRVFRAVTTAEVMSPSHKQQMSRSRNEWNTNEFFYKNPQETGETNDIRSQLHSVWASRDNTAQEIYVITQHLAGLTPRETSQLLYGWEIFTAKSNNLFLLSTLVSRNNNKKFVKFYLFLFFYHSQRYVPILANVAVFV